MLRVKIVCVGKLKDSWLIDAAGEYTKRLKRFCNLSVVEIDETKLSEKPSASQIKQALVQEGAALLRQLGGVAVCLDIDGAQEDSVAFSRWVKDVPQTSSAVTFFVGGSNGLDESVKNACKRRISFSKMTFPHQLFRIMLLEQLYRAFMIAGGGDYHK